MTVLTNVPEKMSNRARAYLLVTFISHLVIGGLCVFLPDSFQSPSYYWIKEVIPLGLWGAGFWCAAFASLIAAWKRSEWWAYFGLISSVVVTMGFCGGFVAGLVLDTSAGYTGPIIWGVLALKDLLQCGNPLRTPFEPIARRVLDEEATVPATDGEPGR